MTTLILHIEFLSITLKWYITITFFSLQTAAGELSL